MKLMTRHRLRRVPHAYCLMVILAVLMLPAALLAQQPELQVEEQIQLNFPTEIEIKALVDYVSERLKISIFYDETIQSKRITVRSPERIPASSLLDLLKSALRMKGLALVDAGAEGWYRVVTVDRLSGIAQLGPLTDQGGASAITETFALKHVDVQQADQFIKPFLTQPGGNCSPIKEGNVLIVTDYGDNLAKVRILLDKLDAPAPEMVTEFYVAQNLSADEILKTISPIVTASTAKGSTQGPVQMLAEPRTNQVALIGVQQDVDRVKALLEKFDLPSGLVTSVYQFRGVSAERVDKLFQELIDPLQRQMVYQSTIDAEANLLVVRTKPELHERLDQLRQQIDVLPDQKQSPVRFVKLKNANVDDVLETLKAIGEAKGFAGGATANQLDPGRDVPVPGGLNSGSLTAPLNLPPLLLPLGPVDERPPGGTTRQVGGGTILPGDVRVSADPLTNSLVLVGNPEEQATYLELIAKLDARRPQVMIEAHIVAIDTSDNFSLGVEVSTGDRSGVNRLFKFTSFGLSEVDATSGALKIRPNLGFNGTLVNPAVADVVVQALANHTRAHVLASPKILVNDNTRGRFENVLSVPFQSVNASQTVSTTSLGGNQQAGTTIDVTPHIKEGKELELEFDVEFSAFSGNGTAGLPPPRQISRAESVVTIPDGHTVIVGGLKQVGTTQTFAGVPYVELIPVLRELTSRKTNDRVTTSFFLFIKPIIVRDDQFASLKYLSTKDYRYADLRARYPGSNPAPIRFRDLQDDSCPPFVAPFQDGQ